MGVSSYLGLHTYIVMSPLVLALLIVAVLGDDTADSGDAKLQLPQGLPPFLQQLAQAGQAPAPGASLPPGSLWIKWSATTSLRSSFSEWSRQRLNTFFPSSLASRSGWLTARHRQS